MRHAVFRRSCATFNDATAVAGLPVQFTCIVYWVLLSGATLIFHLTDGSNGGSIAASLLLAAVALLSAVEMTVPDWRVGSIILRRCHISAVFSTSSHEGDGGPLPCAAQRVEWCFAAGSWCAALGWVEFDGDDSLATIPVDSNDSTASSQRTKDHSALQMPSDHEPHPHTDLKAEATPQPDRWELVTFADLASCMGVTGTASCLQALSTLQHIPTGLWETVACFAAAHYACLVGCIALRVLRQPRSVAADLFHPGLRNVAPIIPIVLLLFSGMSVTFRPTLSLVLFWIGTPVLCVSWVFLLATNLTMRHDDASYSPSALVPNLGLLVASVVAGDLAPHMSTVAGIEGFAEAAKWLWTIGFLFFVLFLSGTLYHAMFYHWEVRKYRGVIALWMCGCFLSCVAYQHAVNTATPEMDTLPFMFFAAGVALLLMILSSVVPGGWLLRGRFDMANWFAGFPLSTFAKASLVYYESQRHAFSYGVLWTAYALAVYANYMCLINMLRLWLRGQWPAVHPHSSDEGCGGELASLWLARPLAALLSAKRRGVASSNDDADMVTLTLLIKNSLFDETKEAAADVETNTASAFDGNEPHCTGLTSAAALLQSLSAMPGDTLWLRFQNRCVVAAAAKGSTVHFESLKTSFLCALSHAATHAERAALVHAVVLRAEFHKLSHRLRMALLTDWPRRDPLALIKLSFIFEDVPEAVPDGLHFRFWR